MSLNSRKSVASVLIEADKTETHEGKLAVLRHNETDTLKILLRLANDQNVKWLLPAGAPPYRPADPTSDLQGKLHGELRKFYLFVEGGNPPPPQMPNVKREQLFIQLLEGIDHEDAKLLLAVKDKDLTNLFNSITVDVIEEAFPGLLINVAKKQKSNSKKKEKNE